jgi:trigger factor
MSTPAEKPGIRVEVAEEGTWLRRLDVTVDADRVRRAFERAYRDLARRSHVRGFRPGKAPRSVLEKLYGASLAEQIEQALVAETLADAVALAGVEPAGEPSVEARAPRPDAEFAYSARIEIEPRFDLPDTNGLPARRPAVRVEEAEVERELEALRQRQAPILEEPEGTAIENGHFVSLDFVGQVDGEPFEGGSGRGVEVEVGAGRMLPGFEEQLLGARAGDDLEVRVRFPERHSAEKLAGREAVFAVHVVEVKRRRLAALDDEFAKDVGDFETLDDLRARIRSDLRELREREARAVLRESLMDALIERTPFEVPPGMVQRELDRQLAAARHRLESALPGASLDAQLAHWKEEWRPRAEREVRERLLLAAVARAESLEPDDAQVEAELARMAHEQHTSPQRLREAFGGGLGEALRARLREEQALDLLAARAKVQETSGS